MVMDVPSMKIKDVADRSGFSAPTLRYYEEIGLLPVPARTPSGYRSYDEHTLDRLAFIARAKQLGCTLEEISDLATAWEGGRCGPIQDRLRAVVRDKLTAARTQMAELTTLTAELQRAAVSLELHRPDGPCDDECGCVTDPGRAAASVAVSLGSKPADAGGVPIACTLSPTLHRGRLADWEALLAHTARRVHLDRGVRVEFSSDVPLDELARLVAAEQDCCQFLEFAITVDSRGIALDVTAPADASWIVESLFGAAP